MRRPVSKFLQAFLCLCLVWAGLAQASMGPAHFDDPADRQGHESHALHSADAAGGERNAPLSGGDCTAPCAALCAMTVITYDVCAPALAPTRAAPYSSVTPNDNFPDADLRPPRLFS